MYTCIYQDKVYVRIPDVNPEKLEMPSANWEVLSLVFLGKIGEIITHTYSTEEITRLLRNYLGITFASREDITHAVTL